MNPDLNRLSGRIDVPPEHPYGLVALGHAVWNRVGAIERWGGVYAVPMADMHDQFGAQTPR